MSNAVILTAPKAGIAAQVEGGSSAPFGPGGIAVNTNTIISWANTNIWQTGPAPSLPAPQQIAGLVPLSPCDYADCRTGPQKGCFMLPVFGSPGVTGSTYENDISPFFIDASTVSYVPTFYLQKANNFYINNEPSGWSNVAILNSNVYGTFFAQGSVPYNPTWTGIQLNWGSVVAAFGNGIYQVVIGTCSSCNDGVQPGFTFSGIGTFKGGLLTGIINITLKVGAVTFTSTFNSTGPISNITNINALGNFLAAFFNSTGLITGSYNPTGQNLSCIGTQYNSQNGILVSLNLTGAVVSPSIGPNTDTFEGGSCDECGEQASLNCLIPTYSGSNTFTGVFTIGSVNLNVNFTGTYANLLTYLVNLINRNGRYTASVISGGIEIFGTKCAADNGTVITFVSQSKTVKQVYNFGKLSGAELPQATCNCATASPPFQLWQWDCAKADHTLKFEIEQLGIKGSSSTTGFLQYFNGWTMYDSVRLPHSYFGNKKYSYDEIYLEHGSEAGVPFGQMNQMRNKAVPGYIFDSGYFPEWLLETIGAYVMMADTILVSDYNSNNSDYFINQKAVIKKKGEGYTPEYRDGERFDASQQYMQRTGKVKVNMEEAIQSLISSIC